MKAEFEVVPMVSIHPGRINLYSEVVWSPYRPKRNPAIHLEGVSNDHAGKVSSVAKRKINKAIDYLLFLANDKVLPDTAHGRSYSFKLAFITLTLPSVQVHSDQEIKSKCLNQFLVEARKKWHVRNYIWRAEKQMNGNLHFHILVDKFIPWSELRDCWNRICNKLGYVDRYRNQMHQFHSGGFRLRSDLLKNWAYKAQIKAYQKGKANDWASPNSTDIHSVHKVKNIKGYIKKYYGKDEQTDGLAGRLWGCNYELSDIPGAKLVVDSNVNDAIQSIFDKHCPKVYEGAYFTCLNVTFDMLKSADSDLLFRALGTFLSDHFNYNLQREIPPD
jgi:hypothetical protein